MEKEVTNDDGVAELWGNYAKTRCIVEKHKLVEKYIGVARFHASSVYKLRPNDNIEYADYYHFAIVGLLEAINSYKSDFNTYFPAYAKHRIRGAILDGITEMTEKSDQMRQEKLCQHRLLSLLENEESSDLFDELVDLSINLGIGHIIDSHGYVSSPLVDYGNHEYIELKQLLLLCIDKLSKDEQIVIRYHYFHEVDFTAISIIMDLTKGRVSQIHKNAINNIRNMYEATLKFDASF